MKLFLPFICNSELLYTLQSFVLTRHFKIFLLSSALGPVLRALHDTHKNQLARFPTHPFFRPAVIQLLAKSRKADRFQLNQNSPLICGMAFVVMVMLTGMPLPLPVKADTLTTYSEASLSPRMTNSVLPRTMDSFNCFEPSLLQTTCDEHLAISAASFA